MRLFNHCFRLLQAVSMLFAYLWGVARRYYPITIVVGICLLGLIGWSVVTSINAPEVGSEIGKRAPDFVLQTLDGESVTLDDFRGRMVILNYWDDLNGCWREEELAQEIYSIQSIRDRWPAEELAILSIVSESSDHAEVQELIDRYGLTVPILLDSEEVRSNYDIMHGGVHFFTDSEGIIKLVINGYLSSPDEIEDMLDGIKNSSDMKGIAPAISDISVSDITDKGAVIRWFTDEPANSDAIVHDAKGVCISILPDEALVTTHSITVDSLSQGTIYDFQVLSGYNRSRTYSFTTLSTDISAPVVHDAYVSSITDSSATINWVTDEPATSEVEYWIADSASRFTVSDTELATNHSLDLVGLETDTNYHFEVKSRDDSGNQVVFEISETFTTLAPFPASPEVGNVAPDFTLQTIGGETVTLSDFRGKTVMVNFWLTSCGACRKEMPHMQAVSDKWSDEKLVVLAVNVRGREAVVRTYIKSRGFTFPVLLDSDGAVSESYQVHRLPTTFFIDADGIIREVKEELFAGQSEIEDILNSINMTSGSS